MIHSFLLIGQSNMAGRGDISDAVDVDSSRIKVLRNGRWRGMYRPVNPDRETAGVNLAERFAELYSKKYNVDVGLIPCADGGTSLNQWRIGGLLFDNAVNNARLAQRTSTIAGVLWHQGEGDCTEEDAPLYAKRLVKIFDALKRELDLYDVPIVLGELGEYLKNYGEKLKNNYAKINEQLKIVAESDKMYGLASSKGLASKPDLLHFDSKSLYEFGERYFDEFEKLRKADKVFVDKPCEDDAYRTELEEL